MSTQLPLFPEPDMREPAAASANPAAAWVLDEETRAIGRCHVAEARAILQARRSAADHRSRRRARAQPAA